MDYGTQVRKKARMLAVPKCRSFAADLARGGRLGDDTNADYKVLKLDNYSRRLLERLLDDAMAAHRWIEAAGIVRVLLQSLSWWHKGVVDGRPFFVTGMEILQRLGEENATRYKKVFNLMYDRQPNSKTVDAKRRQGEVEFERALYMITTGDYEGAYEVSRPVVDGVGLRNNATVNLVYGLILHRLWYERVCEQEHEDESGGFFGDWKPEKEAEHEPAQTVKDAEDGTEDLSILTEASADKVSRQKRETTYEDEEEFWANARVNHLPVMDRRLFPVQVPYQPGEEYKVDMDSRSRELLDSAIDYLQQAVSCLPGMTATLIPLLQLLLAVGDIEGASKEIDTCLRATKHMLPLSMKALLLESLADRDVYRLAECYEEILERNPSSIDAITGLTGLHINGEYGTGALIRTLAMFLDHQPDSVHVWRKLAEAFLELASKVNEEEDEDACDVPSQDLVFTFLDLDDLWRRKHFASDWISENEFANRWKLLTYRAACAAHIYGPDFPFVAKARSVLEILKKERSLALLASHCQNALSLLGF